MGTYQWRQAIVVIPPFLSRTGNVLHAFLRANIQELTFHQTNYCSRLQTIRWFRRSDWKPVGFPFRLKELRTFACLPLAQHRGFYFPPPAKGWRSALSLQNGKPSSPCPYQFKFILWDCVVYFLLDTYIFVKKGKLLRYFPLWREKVKVANFVCYRQIPMGFGKVWSRMFSSCKA